MTTFVKQYGLPRTGTNAVRALLETHVPDTTVLMHVLGDKHSPPVDLQHALRVTERAPDPAISFVGLATLLAPAITTRMLDGAGQRAYVRSIAHELHAQALAGRVRFVLSVREPYDWAHAVVRWRSGWLASFRGANLDTLTELLGDMCEDYNRCNAAWVELLRRHPATAVVRHEELTRDLDPLVTRLAGELRLPGRAVPGARLPRTLGTADWDQVRTPVTAEPEAQRARRVRELAPLDGRLAAVVTRRVDWTLAARWGYAPA